MPFIPAAAVPFLLPGLAVSAGRQYARENYEKEHPEIWSDLIPDPKWSHAPGTIANYLIPFGTGIAGAVLGGVIGDHVNSGNHAVNTGELGAVIGGLTGGVGGLGLSGVVAKNREENRINNLSPEEKAKLESDSRSLSEGLGNTFLSLSQYPGKTASMNYPATEYMQKVADYYRPSQPQQQEESPTSGALPMLGGLAAGALGAYGLSHTDLGHHMGQFMDAHLSQGMHAAHQLGQQAVGKADEFFTHHMPH